MDPCRLTIDVVFAVDEEKRPIMTVHFVGPNREQMAEARAVRREQQRLLVDWDALSIEAGREDADKDAITDAIKELEGKSDAVRRLISDLLKRLCTGFTREGSAHQSKDDIQSAYEGGLFDGEDQAQLFERVCFRKWLEPSDNGAGRPGSTGEGQGSEEREGTSAA